MSGPYPSTGANGYGPSPGAASFHGANGDADPWVAPTLGQQGTSPAGGRLPDGDKGSAGPLPLDGLSIREALHGRGVLITGATGYLGSLVLEQLLRVCGADVGPVFLLARGRRGKGPRERVARLLGSGLFGAVRRSCPDALAKVVVLEGDLALPELGLSPAAQQQVADSVSVVIHSAASIALEDPIQKTLSINYRGTQALLGLAERLLGPRLAALVHVSTGFVGMHLPCGSTVREELLPLMLGDRPVSALRLAEELMEVDQEAADLRAAVLCRMWNLPNTYLLGKHLTEALVAEWRAAGRLAGGRVAIVRPTLVSAVAGQPYPGYVGNLAGPSGYMTAFALGFFNRNSPAWHAHHLLDSVPGDVAAAVTLAAAAALAAGITSREQLMGPPAPSPSSASAGLNTTPPHSAPLLPVPSWDDARGVPVLPPPPPTLPYPKSHSPHLSSPAGPADLSFIAPYQNGYNPVNGRISNTDKHGTAAVVGSASGAVAVSPASHAGLPPLSSTPPPGSLLVLHAATSTVNVCTHMEAYDLAYRFFSTKGNSPRFRFMRRYVKAEADYTPVGWKVAFKKKLTAAKVAMAAGLLGCLGQDRPAHRLRTGFIAWDNANTVKHDKTLFFSVSHVLALEQLLLAHPAGREELGQLPLVWRGNWRLFANTYMAAVCRLFMGYPAPAPTPALPHFFTFIPPEELPPQLLPRMAGEGNSATAAAKAAPAVAETGTLGAGGPGSNATSNGEGRGHASYGAGGKGQGGVGGQEVAGTRDKEAVVEMRGERRGM